MTAVSAAANRTPGFSAAELEDAAREVMTPQAFDFVAGGASSGSTIAANTVALERWRLVPRIWRGTAAEGACDVAVRVAGSSLAAPVLTAPIGALATVHPDAEIAVATAAAQVGMGTVLSTAASVTIEEYGRVASTPWWFQLYWPGDDRLARSLVDRAAAAGAAAIVVTADAPRIGWRPAELAHADGVFRPSGGMAVYLSDPVFRALLGDHPDPHRPPSSQAIDLWRRMFGNHDIRSADIGRLVTWTDLPVLVKGVLHAADAEAVVDAGASGVIVSNHGGRQVDGAIAAIDALPSVCAAVGDRADILFDSGIRSGADVLRAMALGAGAVLYGRPWVYALAIAGVHGVVHSLASIIDDVRITAGLVGVSSLGELDRSWLVRAD